MPIRLPGFINAHAHLEWPARQTPAGTGLPAWVKTLRGGAPPSEAAAISNIEAAYSAGTAYLIDIGNTEAGANALAGRLRGIALREVVGIDMMRLPETPAAYTPHSAYATNKSVISECAKRAEIEHRPFSIHCDEDPDERLYLKNTSGQFADYARALGRDMTKFEPPDCSTIRYLDRLNVLGPRTLLVHCTISEIEDLEIVANSGAAIVLCPASNLHITKCLPNIPEILRLRIPILIGSDSLASSPSFDLLDQVAILVTHFPNVPNSTWVDALTSGAASVLGISAESLGKLEFDAPSLDRLFDGTRWPRRFSRIPEIV